MNSDSEASDSDSYEKFLRLWTRHEPELRAFVRSCCPCAQEVDEVMQEVSVVAWRKFSSLDNSQAFGPWACMIARYELLMARRRHARDRLVLAEDVVKLLAEEGKEEMSLRHQQLEVLMTASRSCHRRGAIWLWRLFAGYTHSRIGDAARPHGGVALSVVVPNSDAVVRLY